MNKVANVVYPYSPKNDDELELKVGDKIEVIGVEEEGWWKGSLKGRVGVFPSNFVQVVEIESPTSTTQNINKLNSKFGSKVGSRNSLASSNSMNNLNSNSNNNLNIHNSSNTASNNNSSNNINLTMNNTHQPNDIDSTNEYPFNPSTEESSNATNPLSERRPKPLRGIGFGDIFAQGARTKPLPTDPMTRSSLAMTNERSGTSSGGGMDSNTLGRLSSSTLQKQIPKKPPPPAPADISGTNGSVPDQAPALPPKPSNQFSPFMHQRPLPNPTTSQRTVREQARVIYAYKPSNDDELEMEVDDIIDIIDKNIEDAGWWKGELKGKVGVFPDNFVQLIGIQDVSATHDTHNSSRLSGSTISNSLNSSGGVSHHQPQASAGMVEGKIKSVFAVTPKGFSKELESNLEKHSNPASFLSLKRSKQQQQMSSSLATDQPASMILSGNADSPNGTPNATGSLVLPDPSLRQNGHSTSINESPSPGKLNHITAHRAKGPTRRPPSNILNKRNQSNEFGNNLKIESSDDTKEDFPPASLPAFKQTPTTQPSINHGSLLSLPSEQQKQPSTAPSVLGTPQISSFTPHGKADPNQRPTLTNGSGEISQPLTPKTNQRVNQSIGQQIETKVKLNPTSTPSTPPWMVELRKNNAEKKRDPLPVATPTLIDEIAAPLNSIVPTPPVTAGPLTPTAVAPTISVPVSVPSIISAPQSAPVAPAVPVVAPPLKPTSTAAKEQTSNDSNSLKSNDMLQEMARNVTNDINELRNDVKRLQEDFRGILGLKDTIETMKTELRTCQSATESQRKYIKELVNNLADERKRIAAMQTEIDRNLK